MDQDIKLVKKVNQSSFIQLHKSLIIAFQVFLLILLISNSLLAQISFDVKTTMEEKKQLHIIKIAVINALKQSNWSRVVEVREDYSLWLTNLQRYSNENFLISEIDLDLRTPAMITHGEHITGVHISVEFDTIGISNVHTSNDTLMNALLVKGLSNSGLLTKFSDMFSISDPLSGYIINAFISDFITEMNRQPTPFESYEANLLAAKAVVELKKLFEEN